MVDYNFIRQLLKQNGINEDYTDEELDVYIYQAKLLLNSDLLETRTHTEFNPMFSGDKYVLDYYPVISVTGVHVDDVEVTPRHVSPSGVLYFNKTLRGALSIEYVVGLNEEEYIKYVIPVLVYLIRDNTGGNIASVSEGDVSVSYSSLGDANITNLISKFQSLYNARLKLA